MFLSLFFVVSPTYAADFSINNKFGIHLATPQDEDLERARELVNSNGGNWGYVTLVIQENDMDVQKWQGIFEKLREKRLIPIIRLATEPEGSNWGRPDKGDAKKWVNFLNSLNWVVKNRYIILFNEPNHSTEWGGEVDPVSFAQVNEEFARRLKASHSDYFIMMGGMDVSAPSQRPRYEDSAIYLEEVVKEIGASDYNSLFDGLSSHSYPNPGFVGPALGTGRGSVRTYQWELTFLKNLGIKDLPVFITETGWDGDRISRVEVAERFRYAYENIWLPDTRVVAVTPFILNYQGEPFLKFSWVQPGNGGVFPEYDTVKGMLKRNGQPEIDQKGSFTFDLPTDIVEESTYHFQIKLSNTGQAIWSKDEDYEVQIEGLPKTQYIISSIGTVKPNQDRTFDIYLNTAQGTGAKEVTFVLYKGSNVVLSSVPWSFTVVPLPSVNIKASLFPKIVSAGEDFELQLFDEYEQLVFKKTDISIKRGQGIIDRVENIALGRTYRAVLIKPLYLPRQTYITFTKGDNAIRFDKMFPIDFDSDGALDGNDFGAFFQRPSNIRLFLPF